MFNDWFSIGPLTVHGYGVMIAVGILAASWLATKLCKEYKLDYENIDSFIIFVIVIGYAFSKLTYCLTVFDQFLSDPLSVLGSGGWVVYGGILGGLLAALIWCKWKKWKFMDYFQVLMPCVSLAQGFGRIGCFFAGCCGGAVTDAWYGIQFPATSLAWNTTQKIIPTQLLSSAGDFLIFAFLMYNLKKGKHPEDTGAWYLILYSVGRFLIEFLRGDLIRGGIGPFSTSQFISLFVVVLGAYMIWNRQRKEEKQ
ncbi:MAG: prolipoprotein diacylglyceryl transferase [Bulleidia sp.]|jgi:phosphatidylglycerol:prolipoprotein diacylglycerol transferase|nr:prolipoprotein diacylglyceryl transferase [Erysipelotrichaceae bacterium]MDD7058636.1 prolipoprotein diacylglyceryl transferase [Erysipelotrichaceae bacterium]MDY3660858.1 prolipoprotein diacylglyceryl transferase [Bulleidia sp.]MEE0559164.1 prolipoprotein diacylglyceryl transferase [Bulleidia sp.]